MSTTAPSLAPHPLKLARLTRGLRQRDLAAQAGVCRETIGRIENGESPRLATALALAATLEVSVERLFPGDN